MKYLSYIWVFVAGAVFTSCNKSSPDCFKKAGKDSSIERIVTPFKVVLLETNIEVTLIKGIDYKVEIFGGSNLLKKITTSVDSGTLVIDNDNGCNFVRGYDHKLKVIVTAPEYDKVITNSVGSIITNSDFVQDTMFFSSEGGDMIINGTYAHLSTSSHGNGNVYFKGATNKMYVYMNGTNYLYAEEGTISNYIFIESVSLADAYITAPTNGTFEYHIWKTGNIYYKGTPVSVDGKSEKAGIAIKK
ncbi:MAG: DUF2807 domain-containing protein [Bacteroidota bacterium]|nr:DUF2807 domain-containing protein [Bacteroidota bacterium]